MRANAKIETLGCQVKCANATSVLIRPTKVHKELLCKISKSILGEVRNTLLAEKKPQGARCESVGKQPCNKTE